MAKRKSSVSKLNYLPRMPRRKRVPIGCIGSGFIMADCHLVAYEQAGFYPAAIASRTYENALAVADRHAIPRTYKTYQELLADPEIEVLDIAVPPDVQLDIIREAVKQKSHIRGILAQKPVGMNYAQAKEAVQLCRRAGITLAINQNMRYDQSVRACKDLLQRNLLGEPVLASIDMRAIPHWMPWQKRLGWVTLRIMSIHHLDTFRYWLGDPVLVFASTRPDPRTAQQFDELRAVVEHVPDSVGTLLVLGHNPGWEELVSELLGRPVVMKTSYAYVLGARGEGSWPQVLRGRFDELALVTPAR